MIKKFLALFKEGPNNIWVVFLPYYHLPVAIFPSSYMCHSSLLFVFLCDHRVTTSQVSWNNPQFIKSNMELAERFKLGGDRKSYGVVLKW